MIIKSDAVTRVWCDADHEAWVCTVSGRTPETAGAVVIALDSECMNAPIYMEAATAMEGFDLIQQCNPDFQFAFSVDMSNPVCVFDFGN